MIITFLNGELMECESVNEVCTTYGIHPSQLELTPISNDDEKHTPITPITHVAFFHPKPRVFLGKHHIIYNITTYDEDDWDPWTVDYTYVYRDCVNTSILTRLRKLHGNTTTYSLNRDQTVDDIWSEVKTDEHIDPGVDYSERYWLNLMCRAGADRDVIMYAISKLRALGTNDETMFEAAYVTYKCHTGPHGRSFVFSVMYDEGVSHPNLWFERDFYHLDFSRILPHIEDAIGKGLWRVIGKVNMVHTFEAGELDERLRRLAGLSTSDEVAEWFISPSHLRPRLHYADLLCRNSNEKIIDYYLAHPEEVKWSAWIENTNRRSLLLPIPLDRVVKLTRNGDVYVNGRLAPHHLLHILYYFSPAVKVPLSTVIESFGQNDDVEVIFDTDISVSFLNGEKMWVCPSDKNIIQHMVARRRNVPVSQVELIWTDTHEVFALTTKK